MFKRVALISTFLTLALGLLNACGPIKPDAMCSNENSPKGDCVTDGPLDYTLYVRGGFNGWGADNPFHYKGNGIYEASVMAAPGNHEFKLASNGWEHQYMLRVSNTSPARLNETYKLVEGAHGSFFFTKKTGIYRFVLDFTDAAAPTLFVKLDPMPPRKSANAHSSHTKKETVNFTTWDDKKETVTFSMADSGAKYREYGQSTTLQLRDPVDNHLRYKEKEGAPRVRSGSLPFDALFAMSMEEMRLDSVSNIEDGNYNQGKEIPCDCFETGAKWHYVWTRDLSYAAHLGLAVLDPDRVVNSLTFKTSDYRPGVEKPLAVPGTDDGMQIVQDTGTGGSWPISTDRTTWSFGAAKVLDALPAKKQKAFTKRALAALTNTVEIDRAAAFDETDGLYRGEQSFLDWREQTYSQWITRDISSLGTSKSLSTNVNHYSALRLTARLSKEAGQHADAMKYNKWASDLRTAINKRLWLEDVGQYSSITGPHFGDAALYKYDWLGISLAVISGVAPAERAQQAIENYPHGPMGAPVIFPQQPGIPVYHNRAIWPFVTAYGLQAAIKTKNAKVADAAYDTLIRAASLNMSNMENLEWLSAQPLLLDEIHPEMSGPIINSQRQLWSVAGYLGMVLEGVFGVKTSSEGLTFQPFITSKLRRDTFANSRSIALYDLTLRNALFDLRVFLPERSTQPGYYAIKEVLINGKPSQNGFIAWKDLAKKNTVVVRLGDLVSDGQKITRVEGNPYAVTDPSIYAPVEPSIVSAKYTSGRMLVTIEDTKNKASDNISYALYRDGRRITDYENTKVLAEHNAKPNACYTVEAKFNSSGTRSHHSEPYCVGETMDISVKSAKVSSNRKVINNVEGRKGPSIIDWGAADDTLRVSSIEISKPGRYAFQLKYHNGYNLINLGITNGVKWAVIYDENMNKVAEGLIQMPHANVHDGKRPWKYSTPLIANLPAGSYTVNIEDFINMSYLSSNITFANSGGARGPVNRFDISGLRVTPLTK